MGFLQENKIIKRVKGDDEMTTNQETTRIRDRVVVKAVRNIRQGGRKTFDELIT